MKMYRVVENGVYYNIVPRGLYGNVEGEPHMRGTDETDVTFMIYEQIRAFMRVAADLKLADSQIEEVMFTNSNDYSSSSHLIYTGDGLMLMDTVMKNIESLNFNRADIKYPHGISP